MNECDECGLFPANIHYTRIEGDTRQSFHLCESCAKKRGISVTIADHGTAAPSPATAGGLECNGCGMKYSEFKRYGRLGCSGCYGVFCKEIDGLHRELHGSLEHKGKKYRGANGRHTPDGNDYSRLHNELIAAIVNEEFERAALLRDTLHDMEKTEKK
jgi:protein arginine kinase activator